MRVGCILLATLHKSTENECTARMEDDALARSALRVWQVKHPIDTCASSIPQTLFMYGVSA